MQRYVINVGFASKQIVPLLPVIKSEIVDNHVCFSMSTRTSVAEKVSLAMSCKINALHQMSPSNVLSFEQKVRMFVERLTKQIDCRVSVVERTVRHRNQCKVTYF